jgi:hypothetical protein
MKRMGRRRFLIASTAAAVSLKTFAQTVTPQTATLTRHPDRTGARIPANFVGLSYETQQLSQPDFFSPANTGLIAQFRALAPHGVLRLGGNTSDYGFWKATPDAAPPPRAPRPFRVGDPPPDLTYNVTPDAVRNLRAFLDATGWTCLYGINFGTNTPALAADEAAFVSKTLGPRLEYFQVGNEADRFGSTIRDPKTWNANTYFDEWLTFANAIRARVPTARFGLPDTSGAPQWYAVVVDRLLALAESSCAFCAQSTCDCAELNFDPKTRPSIAALTHHYYVTGPPDNPKATIANLLQPNPRVDTLATNIRAAAARLSTGEHRSVPYRMTEGNTCYRGGKPGLSDVFAASLWAADYLLQLAQLGYAGANLHGGDSKVVATGLGGKLPGDDLVADDPASHPHPYYTPIAHIADRYIAEPVSFGMRFAQQFAGATLFDIDFDSVSANATAYAAKFPDGRTIIAIINKDANRDVTLSLPGFRIVQRLTAESLTSTTVKFGAVAPVRSITIPAASAAILQKAG